eukprot:7090472-Prymnesium_polylepis.1
MTVPAASRNCATAPQQTSCARAHAQPKGKRLWRARISAESAPPPGGRIEARRVLQVCARLNASGGTVAHAKAVARVRRHRHAPVGLRQRHAVPGAWRAAARRTRRKKPAHLHGRG